MIDLHNIFVGYSDHDCDNDNGDVEDHDMGIVTRV